MKIMIIDDDLSYVKYISECLYSYIEDVIIEGSNSFNRDYSYDIYFLDIDMPNVSGIDIAKEITLSNEESIIIYVSYREDLIFEALQTFPYYFLRKKYIERDLPIIIDKVKKKYITPKINIIYKTKEIQLSVNDIYYIEKDGQYSLVHTKKHIYKVKHTMKYIKEILPDTHFGIVSQSCIVNFKYVKYENIQYVIMNDEKKFYYSRGKREMFLENYFKYIA